MSEQAYLNLLQELVDVAEKGQPTEDRTGVGTWSLFHRALRFDLSEGFPLLTTKRMGLKSIIGELLWFIEGNTNADYLEEKYGSTIWREWKDEGGDLGKIYGHQWRNFGETWHSEYDGHGMGGYDYYNRVKVQKGFDQLQWLINEIKTNPNSRRLYVTAANPNDRYEQALDCCHNYFQVMIKGGALNLYFQMRSTDVFLGLPYNLASYAALAHMLALETGYRVGELVYSGVNVHLYSNHLEQAKEQLKRKPNHLPDLIMYHKPFFEYTLEDFKVVDYVCHPVIKAPVAI